MAPTQHLTQVRNYWGMVMATSKVMASQPGLSHVKAHEVPPPPLVKQIERDGAMHLEIIPASVKE